MYLSRPEHGMAQWQDNTSKGKRSIVRKAMKRQCKAIKGHAESRQTDTLHRVCARATRGKARGRETFSEVPGLAEKLQGCRI